MKQVLSAIKQICYFPGLFGQQRPLRLTCLLLLASLLLSGCVQYDIGINFDSPNRGEIVQHIKLGRLIGLSDDQAQEWLDSIQRRAQQLQGKTKKFSDQEIAVTIPFYNGADLEAKFNEFFNPYQQNGSSAVKEVPLVSSRFSLTQNNFLLLLRNRLSYDLDLQALSPVSIKGNVPISSDEILDFEFSLNTPWGARELESENAVRPNSDSGGRHLVWTLTPGQLNHIEAVFWLPSPIGIGTIVITLFVWGGIYLRYKFMPAPLKVTNVESATVPR